MYILFRKERQLRRMLRYKTLENLVPLHYFFLPTVVECSPGTFSSTGYQPCSPCPAGSYQPNSRGTACLECGSGSPGAFCPVASEEV